ncbi:MAG: bifunctional phosphoribosylaminoimidazolecarboxamide formyltransferase/IMP cyclohydrolase [Betaproteobacteria bacterium]|nr:bifunctional phosphoribosylaminoimidazolecarboxamide formyltransferase/IMP cyclohydrolase [Betaproteobacteria bacterium]MDE1981943.1 bifunctional phosphoribosylaminoimidazolecarboxamide formyltransferase/IMP cyclohydrolase [Betaproteobacteria bacterium]MDE2211351.1 bifunctional phosphoribosylaminoimidazolecarboxamide formyltransferase/IMP cyclohydrolase [Betaproteobacteria bacterium]
MTIQRALISVSNKQGAVEFARALHHLKVEILSTGGTARLLRDAGIPVIEVSNFTGFPEILDGRVKTLHPKIHGGLLGRRDLRSHTDAMAMHGIAPIDLVVVNLYPFRETIAHPDCTLEDAIENIDIGGPAMVRSGAKNYRHVAVLTDPADYKPVLAEMKKRKGDLSDATRFKLAVKAFSHTAEYDGAIANYLSGVEAGDSFDGYPERLHLTFTKHQSLRYGENPHQSGAFYQEPRQGEGVFAQYRQLQGKELSYNNIADSDAAWDCVRNLNDGACVIVKHANPCGVALGSTSAEAYQRAFETDPTSAFGGIIAFNRPVDGAAAERLLNQFVEVLIAPDFAPDALQILATKPNIRVLQIPLGQGHNGWDMKRVGGGLLVQTPDTATIAESALRVVTKTQPGPQEMADLRLAFHVAHYVKSNAIVFCGNGRTLGIGAGQMSRVDSTRIARRKAEDAGLPLQGSVAASDAFFPFRDGLDVIAEAGIKAIIQPGGSLKDQEVIAAADEHGIAMVFTGIRHFRH